MKIIFKYTLVLIIAIIIGLLLKNHSGYLLITFHHWSFQTPLWFALLFFVVAFVLLHYFLLVLRFIENGSYRWRHWRLRRHKDKSYNKTTEGLLQLLSAHFKKAERLLIDGAKNSHKPIINYLAAAYAAQQLKALSRRDKYLSLAKKEDLKAYELYRKLTKVRYNTFE